MLGDIVKKRKAKIEDLSENEIIEDIEELEGVLAEGDEETKDNKDINNINSEVYVDNSEKDLDTSKIIN